MSDVRARYWPGNAAGLHRDGLTVLVDVPADTPLAEWLAKVVQEDTSLEPLLDLLFENGIAAAPDFVIVAGSDPTAGSVVVARGSGRVHLASGEVVEGGIPFVSRTVPVPNAVLTLGPAPDGPTLRAFDGVLSVAGWRLGEGADLPAETPAAVNDEPSSPGAEVAVAPDVERDEDGRPDPVPGGTPALAVAVDDPFAAFGTPNDAEVDVPVPSIPQEPIAPASADQAAPSAPAESAPATSGRAETVPDQAAPDEAEESAYLSTYRRLLQPDLPSGSSAPGPTPPSGPAALGELHEGGARTEFPGISLAKAPYPPPSAPPRDTPPVATPARAFPPVAFPPTGSTTPAVAAPPGFIDSVPFGDPPARTIAHEEHAAPAPSPFAAFDAPVAAPLPAASPPSPSMPFPMPGAPAEAFGSPAAFGDQALDGRTVSRASVSRAVAPQTVLAKKCPQGHLTQANAPLCRVCAAPVPPQEVITVNRPVLGRLVLPTGEVYVLDRAVVLGRDPKVPTGTDGELPHLVRIVDPRQEISGQHAMITLDHWNIELLDLGSTNGTEIVVDGHRERLVPTSPVPLRLGSRIVLAEILEIRVEAAP